MPQPILSPSEIQELGKILRKSFADLAGQKEKTPLARYIKYPQIPPILSESLACHLVSRGLIADIKDHQLERGVNNRDITATKNGDRKIIEVKATSDKGWQRLSAKDVSADYLIWIHFGRFFKSNTESTVQAFVIPSPGNYYNAQEDVLIKDIQQKVGRELKRANVDFIK